MTEADHGVRIAVLETKVDGFETRLGELSDSIRWLTRSIFGLMVAVVIGVAVTATTGGVTFG